MGTLNTPGKFQLWTLSQRKALLCMCTVGIFYLAIQQWRQPVAVPDPVADSSPRSAELDNRLDPNTADAAALSAIPNLGEIKAGQIVAYRETFEKEHPHEVAFNSLNDFSHIKGIGPATLSNLETYLRFPKKR